MKNKASGRFHTLPPAIRIRNSQSALAGILILFDLAAVILSFMIAIFLRMRAPWLRPFGENVQLYIELWPILFLWPIVFWREGLYRGLWISGGNHLRRIVEATTLASLLVMAATFVTKTGPQYSRAVIIGGWLLSMPFLSLERFVLKSILTALGFSGPRAVIIGAGRTCEMVLDALQRQRPPAMQPVAIFDDDPGKQGKVINGVPIMGTLDHMAAWAQGHHITTAILAIPGAGRERILELVEEADSPFQRIVIIPDLAGISTSDTSSQDLGGMLALEVKRNLTYSHNRVIKRVLDILLTLLFSPLAVILTSFIAGAIILEDRRPVFFGQTRVGYQGKIFKAWKFRTMVPNAEAILERYLTENPAAREEWNRKQKLARDPRLTIVGRFLRRFSLDELPQLWNVLRGEMSIIGPRPIMEKQTDLYGQSMNLYIQVRPGLTGLWQISGRASTTFQERVEMDTYYVRNWSIWLDLVILARTFWAVVSGRGAY